MEIQIANLCKQLDIPVPTPSNSGEYFIAFEGMNFVVLKAVQDTCVLWTRIMNMPSNTLRFEMELQHIGEVSLSLLVGLTSTYFPFPFLVGYELRLGMCIPLHGTKDLLSACTILLEDTDFWKQKCNVQNNNVPIPQMRGILKF